MPKQTRSTEDVVEGIRVQLHEKLLDLRRETKQIERALIALGGDEPPHRAAKAATYDGAPAIAGILARSPKRKTNAEQRARWRKTQKQQRLARMAKKANGAHVNGDQPALPILDKHFGLPAPGSPAAKARRANHSKAANYKPTRPTQAILEEVLRAAPPEGLPFGEVVTRALQAGWTTTSATPRTVLSAHMSGTHKHLYQRTPEKLWRLNETAH